MSGHQNNRTKQLDLLSGHRNNRTRQLDLLSGHRNNRTRQLNLKYGHKNRTRQLNLKQVSVLHLIIHCSTVVKVFRSLKKRPTPKISTCFVVINSGLFNLFLNYVFESCFRTLAVILVSDLFIFLRKKVLNNKNNKKLCFTSTPCLSSSLFPSSFIIFYLLTPDEDCRKRLCLTVPLCFVI